MNRNRSQNPLARLPTCHAKRARILEELFVETKMSPHPKNPTLKTIGDRLVVVPGRFRDIISQERMVGCRELLFAFFFFYT